MMFVIGFPSSVSAGRARAASAPLTIATDATGRRNTGSSTARGRSERHAPPTARKWPCPVLAVEMPRLHDDQRANGILGDERQIEQYLTRLLGRFRPDGGVRVRSAQTLGKTQGVRLLREAKRLARRRP